jgi:hypothetical protein
MKTTRPLELLYLTVIPIQTRDEGVAYSFFVIDDFSQYAFGLGIDLSLDEMSICKSLIQLTQEENFRNGLNDQDFTLMIPFELGQPAQDMLNQVYQQFKGKVVHNQKVVLKKTKPFVKEMSNIIMNRHN